MHEFFASITAHVDSYSPPVEVTRIGLDQGDIFVVRDDLLEGGTKQRAAGPFILENMRAGFNEFVYASPFAGFAQVALAVACRNAGTKAVIFAEEDIPSGRAAAHEFTRLAQSFGAQVELCPSLDDAEYQSRVFASLRPRAMKVPLGFNTPQFKEILSEKVREQWQRITRRLKLSPKNVWLPVGSGTLAHIFRAILPPEIRLNCIDVRVLPAADPRIAAVAALENVVLRQAPQAFAEACGHLPPVPSNKHYDAKLWEFVVRHAEPGDMWWNVAR